MENRPSARVTTATMIAGPRVLHLHPTTMCSPESSPGHLHESSVPHARSLEFFENIVRAANASESLREVALSLHLDAKGVTSNREALKKILAVTRETDMRLGVTTRYENVKAWGTAAFAGCQSVTLSVDASRFPSLRLPAEVRTLITQLQSEGIVVNFDLLLGKTLIDTLTVPRLKRWLGTADQIFLRIPKHVRLDFSKADLLEFFDRLAPVWESAEKFFHLHVDSCIKPDMFPWNLLTSGCEDAASQVNVRPDGGLAQCALDDPFVTLSEPDDFGGAITRFYVDQPDSVRPTCPPVEFLHDA